LGIYTQCDTLYLKGKMIRIDMKNSSLGRVQLRIDPISLGIYTM